MNMNNYDLDNYYFTKEDGENLYKKIESLMPKIENIEPGELIEITPHKKRNYVYLAGNISSDIRTYEWRERFIELVKNEPNIVSINPCANKFNQAMKTADGDGIEFLKEASKRSQKILRAKDYQLVNMCSCVVVNLGYNTKKPMIGTIQELVWAHDVFYTPVIAICTEDNYYTSHPWVDECISAKVETVEEAVETLKTFFVEY